MASLNIVDTGKKKLYTPFCISFLGKIENEVSSVVKNQRGVPQYEKVGEFFLPRFSFVHKLVVKMYHICHTLYPLMIFNFNIHMCIYVGAKSAVFSEFHHWHYESSEGPVPDTGTKVRGHKPHHRSLLNAWAHMYSNTWQAQHTLWLCL